MRGAVRPAAVLPVSRRQSSSACLCTLGAATAGGIVLGIVLSNETTAGGTVLSIHATAGWECGIWF